MGLEFGGSVGLVLGEEKFVRNIYPGRRGLPVAASDLPQIAQDSMVIDDLLYDSDEHAI